MNNTEHAEARAWFKSMAGRYQWIKRLSAFAVTMNTLAIVILSVSIIRSGWDLTYAFLIATNCYALHMGRKNYYSARNRTRDFKAINHSAEGIEAALDRGDRNGAEHHFEQFDAARRNLEKKA